MITSIKSISELTKILRDKLIELSELPQENVLNGLSLYGSNLEKNAFGDVYESFNVSDTFIVFELNKNNTSDDMSETNESNNINIYTSYSLSLMIYGDNSDDISVKLKAKFLTEDVKYELEEKGVHIQEISDITSMNEYKNDMMWQRADMTINISVRQEYQNMYQAWQETKINLAEFQDASTKYVANLKASDSQIYLVDSGGNIVGNELTVPYAVKASVDGAGNNIVESFKNVNDTIENMNKVMPTDINIDSNYNLILEHDGTEITGQKKQVVLPPFSYSGAGTYNLNGILEALRYEASYVVARTNLFIGNGNYVDDLVGDRYSFKTYNPDYSKATFGFGVNPSNNDWNFRVVYDARQDVDGDSGINPSHWTYDIIFPRKSGTVALAEDIDTKLNAKLDKVAKTDSWQVYGEGTDEAKLPYNNGRTIKISEKPEKYTLMNRGKNGNCQVEKPINDKDIANKIYVDGRMDYIVFNDTIFSARSTLTQTEYNDLYAFYNKHYNKDKIPLFAIDKNGFIASVSLETNYWVDFTLFNDKLSPITLTIQVSTDTGHSRQFSYNSGYLHNILGQDAWKKDVKARIGVNTDNKLIITDESGNETPEQSPSVLIPPFSKEGTTFILDDNLKLRTVKIHEYGMIDFNSQAILILQGSDFVIRMPHTSGSITYTDYVFSLRDDIGGDVAVKRDLDNFERKTVLSNVLPTDNILLDLHNYQLESPITSDFSFIMPTDASDEYLSEISFTTGPTLVAFTTTSAITFTGEDCSNTHTFVPDTNKHYNIIFWKDKSGFQAVVRGY